MRKIDTHQHFWKYNTSDYVWMDDRMEILQKDYLPPDLQREQQKAGFNGSVAVQARQMESENDFLLGLAEQYTIIKGIVGWVDLRSDDVEERLDQYSRYPKFRGVRHVIHDEPDDDFMLGPVFMEGISRLRDFGLTYDILIFEKHLDNTIKFVSKFPDQKFVINHIAKPLIRDRILEPWASRIQEVAKYENVRCKISGMVGVADWNDWKEEDFFPYMETIYNAFGPERLMVGSDWPVCRLAGEYPEVMKIVDNFVPEEDKEQIFWKNAVEFYGLDV